MQELGCSQTPGSPLGHYTAAVAAAEPAAAVVRHTNTPAVRADGERRCSIVQLGLVAVEVVDKDFEGFGEFASSVTSPQAVFVVLHRLGR